MPTHLHSGELAHFARTSHCNLFFFRLGSIDRQLERGLIKASTGRVSWAAGQAREAVVRLADEAGDDEDVVPLVFLLHVLNHHTSLDSIFSNVEVRKRLTSLLRHRRQGSLWPFRIGEPVSSTASALVLKGFRDPETVEALEIFADGRGGYYPGLSAEEVESDDTMAEHRRQVDFATTCLIRALRSDVGLETKTSVEYLASRFESRSGLYFANPYMTDWALAWALRGAATALRERLASDILASMNEDDSFGRYDLPMSTALAILALTSLGVGGEAVRLARLRLADLMMTDGHWPHGIPFYSSVVVPRERLPGGALARLMLGRRKGQLVWLRDAIYAVAFYEDRHRLISTSLAVLALTQPGAPSERGASALSMQRRESCHPRYRCKDHMEYIASYALPPYIVA